LLGLLGLSLLSVKGLSLGLEPLLSFSSRVETASNQKKISALFNVGTRGSIKLED
jgi:hypothetical protein